MSDHESIYPELNRATFLIERTCVPRYYPICCSEIGQLLAEMERHLSQQQKSGGVKDVSG